jgi:hypothetical protein
MLSLVVESIGSFVQYVSPISALEQTGKYPGIVVLSPRLPRSQKVPVELLFCVLVQRADGYGARTAIVNETDDRHRYRLQVRNLSLPDGFLDVEAIGEDRSRVDSTLLALPYRISDRKTPAPGVIVAREVASRCTALLCKEQTMLLDAVR